MNVIKYSIATSLLVGASIPSRMLGTIPSQSKTESAVGNSTASPVTNATRKTMQPTTCSRNTITSQERHLTAHELLQQIQTGQLAARQIELRVNLPIETSVTGMTDQLYYLNSGWFEGNLKLRIWVWIGRNYTLEATLFHMLKRD